MKIKIDATSKLISDEMVFAVKKLSKLVDVDYFQVLAKVFGDQDVEDNEKINFIYNEVTEIYETGDSIFAFLEHFINSDE